ncbi:translation initiation factor IF-2 [Longimonas halophila]|uniref:Translation initiation factor IF-2 n=1 Tax=Longimonas halophila TaxID=1469170 RepID=A0A2H3NTG7_9BACT|nr:translation initiation factor IF-2 [Longimonas halophila]PEN09516.1 translation initiation factor IF-2 [Longimonas halophila]
MATTDQNAFKKKRLFRVAQELNISTDRVEEFLKEEGYEDALTGSGLTAKIADEEAYLVLREKYADDAQAAERIRELRASDAADSADRDEVASIDESEGPSPEPTAKAESAPEASSSDPSEAVEEEEPDVIRANDRTKSGGLTVVGDSDDEETPEEASEPADATADADAQAEPAADAEDDTPVADGKTADEQAADDAEHTDGTEADAVAEEPVADEPPTDADSPADEAGADADTSSSVDTQDAVSDEEPLEEEEAAEAVAEDAVAEADDESTDAAETPEEPAAEATEAEAEDDVQADTEAQEGVADTSEDDEASSVDAEADTEMEDEAAVSADATEDESEEADAVASDEEVSDEADGSDEASEGESPKDETLKANRYRLTGTQVVGKVDLSKMRRRKRKRKRKKKEKKEQKKKERQQKKQKQRQKKKRKKKKSRKPKEEDVEKTIQETLQELEQGASRARQRRRRRRRQRHEEERKRERERKAEQESVLRVTEYVSTGELANLMGEPVKEVIASLFDAGMMVSINQRLDRDTIEFIAAEYDMEVEFIDEFSTDAIEVREDDPEDLEKRAPVVTVMGHVDHGKTSLLDYIRSANVVAGEEGGITQHIGAHQVDLSDQEGSITFLDTPGHEAFTAMRARGAKATDIVILVVAADDSVMPQTIEAINHSQAADVPLVVAINKMDKPEADAQRVKAELAEHNVLVEEYGGNVQSAEVSAETGDGIDDLLEKVLLQSELLELKANPDREADGVIIESRLEKGRGNVVTVLVQNGTLEVGDPFVAGMYSGRVRAMFDERDNRIEEVGPSQPALILGCNGSPEVGDQFVVLDDEGEAREIAQNRQRIHREQELRRKSQLSLDEIGRRLSTGEYSELNLIVKADVGGSVEALADALLKLRTDEVAVRIIHSGVGAINESDVMLARASEAVIIGFQVRPTSGARDAAKREEVDIRTYSIIYDAIEDVHDALEGMLSPEKREEVKGRAEVREIFKVPGVGTVAGSYVTDGVISRDFRVRVLREGVVVYEGELSSLKRFQDDVKEVKTGYECGISIENFDDIKVGDEFECYVVVEERRTLEV